MTDLLSDGLMLSLQALDVSAMPGTVVVRKRTQSLNSKGETTASAWVDSAPVRCRFLWEGTAPTDGIRGERTESGAMATVTVPLGVPVSAGDHVVVTYPDFHPSTPSIEFAVVGPDPMPGAYSTSVDVHVETLSGKLRTTP